MEGQIAKIIIPMLKNQAVNTNSHDFTIAKIRPSSLECILAVSFQPLLKPNHLFESIIPHFNQDRRHFTPAFVLPRDEKFYRENINFEKLKFDERILSAQQKNIDQRNCFFRPPSNFCQLCKASFEDYTEHTRSQQHLNQIEVCAANIFIDELVAKFVPFPKKTQKITKSSRSERGKRLSKKNSCKLSDSNITNIAQGKNVSATESKNSHQSTNLISNLC